MLSFPAKMEMLEPAHSFFPFYTVHCNGRHALLLTPINCITFIIYMKQLLDWSEYDMEMEMDKGCLLGQFFFIAVVICRVVLKSVLAMFLRQ